MPNSKRHLKNTSQSLHRSKIKVEPLTLRHMYSEVCIWYCCTEVTIIRLRERLKEMEQDLEDKMAVSICTVVWTIGKYGSLCALCAGQSY